MFSTYYLYATTKWIPNKMANIKWFFCFKIGAVATLYLVYEMQFCIGFSIVNLKQVCAMGTYSSLDTLAVQLTFSKLLFIKIFKVCLRTTDEFTSWIVSGGMDTVIRITAALYEVERSKNLSNSCYLIRW